MTQVAAKSASTCAILLQVDGKNGLDLWKNHRVRQKKAYPVEKSHKVRLKMVYPADFFSQAAIKRAR